MKKIILLLTFIVCGFILKAQISSSNFGSRTDFSTGSNGAISIATGDMDGDGKKDVVVANQSTGVISIFKNNTTSSVISFASRIDSTVGGSLCSIHLTDLDGDGKLDIALCTGTNNTIAVYKNISTTGTILIGPKQTFAVGNTASGMWMGDLDGDGKTDIVSANYNASSYSVLRNTSSSGTIGFAAAATTSIGFSNPCSIMLSDLDLDGKLDIVIFINGTNVAIYRNTTTTTGSITISSTAVTLTANSGSLGGDVADMDGDGKPDIACSNYVSGNTSVFRNTSTTGSISFAAKVDFAAPGNIQSTMLKDLDMDGKPELIQSTGSGLNSKISIYRSYAVSGSINSSSFGTRLDYTSADAPTGLDIKDIDGDGKPEILSANFNAASFSVFKNDVVPSNGLVVYYPFNGNANDASGFGNHATIYGGATLTTDRNNLANSAFYFNGATSAYLATPSSPSINMSAMNGITTAFWFRADSVPSISPSNREIFQLLDASIRAYDIYFNYATKKFLVGNYNGVSIVTLTYSNNTYNYNTWYHVTVVSDSTNTTKLYINGVLDVSFSVTLSKPINPALYVGENGVNNWNIQGKIDELRVYNRALSYAEIQQIYATVNSTFIRTYYSKTTGNLNTLSTWGTDSIGTGTIPPGFSQDSTRYIVMNNSSPAISSDWIITGTNTAVIFGDGTNALNTSIPSGMTFGADSIYVRNNVTYTVLGTLITNKPGFENGSTVQYTAAGTQTLQTASYSNLVVSGGTKTLSANITVRGTLAMIANINCGINTLTLGASTAQTGTLTYGSGTVTGNFARWFAPAINSGSTGLFPTGTSTQYRPVQIEYTSAPSTGGVLTAVFNATNPGNSGLNPALNDFTISPIVSVNKAAPNGYWTVTPSNGITGGTYTGTLTATGFYGVNSLAGLRLLRRSNSSSAWALTGTAVTPTGTTSVPVVQRTGISSNGGDFGIGADSTVNPLPIKFLSFEANMISQNEVLLKWKTGEEINNDHFEVERSTVNGQWSTVGKVKGNGTTNSVQSYQFTDHTSTSLSMTQTIYYRLRQTDFDGNFDYSKTISVNVNSIQQPVSIYPNPNDGNFIIENTLVQNATITMTMTNLVGEKIWSDFYSLQSGKNTTAIKINSLSPGIYFLKMEDESKQFIEVTKVFVR